MNEFLTDQMREFAQRDTEGMQEDEQAFRETFQLLADTTKSDSFRRFDANKDKFMGGFLLSAFETVAIGLGFNNGRPASDQPTIDERIKGIWTDQRFTRYFWWRGKRFIKDSEINSFRPGTL